jgi:hypothetical protein
MHAMKIKTSIAFLSLFLILSCSSTKRSNESNPGSIETGNRDETKYIKFSPDGSLRYIPDEKGNIIPDFSRVGYNNGDSEIPDITIVKTIQATGTDADQGNIQNAIDEVSKKEADKSGFKGAVLLKKGLYKISSTLIIHTSGVVLKGEADTENGTKILFTADKQLPLLAAAGTGSIREIPATRVKITDAFVPVGARSFSVSSAKDFIAGDKIILYRPGTKQWIEDLKMDQIVERQGTKQWQATEYNLMYERVITKVEGNKVFIDNPVVMEMEPRYGGGEIYKYEFNGRLKNVGIENIYMQSEYKNDTDEEHGWDAISFNKIENSWIRNVTAKNFGYSCVNLGRDAKNISVLNSNCFDHKSQITGGRRYSFNNDGQLNLFMNCHATDGRHDFVTGAKVNGPNVFANCTAKRTHADIGPHHRWSSGTLYDNIVTDGDINVQDRGQMGSGHGWVGITQILWNCTVRRAAVQVPYVNGMNYAIGVKGEKALGHFKDRPQGYWEAPNQTVQPVSLYLAQLQDRKSKNSKKQ